MVCGKMNPPRHVGRSSYERGTLPGMVDITDSKIFSEYLSIQRSINKPKTIERMILS